MMALVESLGAKKPVPHSGPDRKLFVLAGIRYEICAPGGTRTPNRLIRSQMPYPIEPRTLVAA